MQRGLCLDQPDGLVLFQERLCCAFVIALALTVPVCPTMLEMSLLAHDCVSAGTRRTS